MKPKLLCILHRSPPAHGASKVGDFIAQSKKLQESYDCKFITIKSSNTIEDIGKANFKKFYLVFELYMSVLWALISFRPDKIYYTASISSVAFYRDILISTLWKFFKIFKKIDVYYHYHTKGVDKFIKSSKRNLMMTNFFLDGVNLILLSPLLEDDFKNVSGYKNVFYLGNGVEDPYSNNKNIEDVLKSRYSDVNNINILYLSNMIKSKGYFEVLKLAQLYKDKSFIFHFAGGWQDSKDKVEFFDFIKKNDLDEKVIFHGFVNGVEKRELFEKAHFFIFPTRYKNEAFPLSILESFSYGVPVIVTDEASIPYIVDGNSGIVLDDTEKLPQALMEAKERLLNIDTSKYCQKRYKENFSLEEFENNLVTLLNN